MTISPTLKVVARKYILASLYLSTGLVYSAEQTTLPEPLTLKYALELSTNINPDLAFSLAEKNLIASEKSLAISEHGVNVSLNGRISWFERTNALITQTVSEKRLSIRLSKPIYDFGTNEYKINASDKLLESNSLSYKNEIYLRQVRIMEAYFEVLLADLQFHRNNENMAIAFISWDVSKDKNELGTLSDLEVEKQHSEYQRIRRERFESENAQRQTRNRLSILMYTQGQLPSTLATPEPSSRIKYYPDIDKLTLKAFNNNLELKALRKKIASVKSTVLTIKSQMKPQINFNGEANAYNTDATENVFSRDNWNVGFDIDMPLYDSGIMDSKTAKIRSEIYSLEALLSQKKALIQHELLTLKLRLDTLRFERDEANAYNDYSELYLDEKRALYEMEVKSTLGTAMVQISDAQYGVAKSQYETLLTWAKIDVLIGEEPAKNLFIK